MEIKPLSVVLSSVTIAGFLYFLPTTNPKGIVVKEPVKRDNTALQDTFDKQLAEVTLTLDSNIQPIVRKYQNLLTTQQGTAKIPTLDTLTNLWDSAMRPGVAVHYAKNKAELTANSDDWIQTGKRFLGLGMYVQEAAERNNLFQEAEKSFQKSITIDPNSATAKIGLASVYVESTNDPMKGIMLLRGILEKDSNNWEAHLNLGFFSMKSAQYDKAIKRFEKVATLKPDYVEIYLYLAEACEAQRSFPQSISYLQKYQSLNKDPLVQNQLQQKIGFLKLQK